MEFNERTIKKISIVIIISILAILAFILIKPLISAIVSGLVLAYVVHPVYKRINLGIKNNFLSAAIVVLLLIIVIVLPLWFIIPLLVNQVFELFKISQALNIQSLVEALFPTASAQFITQITITLNNALSTLTSGVLNSLTSFLLNIYSFFLNVFVLGFVLFYALKDSEKLKTFASEISPLNKSKEKLIVNQFKGTTDSIVYGIFVVGIIQGILTGIGLLIFGIENALVLTIIATFLSLIPMLGPYFVWIPVSILLFVSGQTSVAFVYLLYNVTIVSTVDNFLRAYLVARKTDLSQVVVLIGMVSGLIVFGFIGLFIGPLILGYTVTLLRSYRDNNLYSLFSEENISK